MARDLRYDEFLKEACPPLELEWRTYRRRAARRRVLERMGELGLSRYQDYLKVLQADATEAEAFPNRIRLTLSRFFREHERWAQLSEALEVLLSEEESPAGLRAWSAGCCGGEEPYSLAILWESGFAARYPGNRLAITATDIDGPSLRRAEEGCYDTPSLRELSPESRKEWFQRESNRWRLVEGPRRIVSFRKIDLLMDEPAGPFDLVLCRYLAFTYYRGERRRRAAARLWSALRPGGILFIGRKEGLAPADCSLFSPWREDTGIFRKVSA